MEVLDEHGKRLLRARLPEGIEGISRLHALLAEHLDDDWVDADTGLVGHRVVVGIETDRGAWVQALVAAGYQVFAINPMSVARYRERHSTSGAKSDAGDAHVLAEIVRLDRDHHRPVAGDSEQAARLTRPTVTAALRRARRRDIDTRTTEVIRLLRAPALRQPPVVERAYAAIVTSQVRLISGLIEQIDELEQVVGEGFGQHPAAETYLSQPGLGTVLAARVLAEFGDDPHRYTDARARARARKNYAGTSPITRASGKRHVVLARYARNRRLADAVHQWAFCALTASPGARAYYDTIRARGTGHHAALRQLGNRLVGILHGCLKTSTPYDETTAWAHHHTLAA